MGFIPILPIFAVSGGYTLPQQFGHAATFGPGFFGFLVLWLNLMIGSGGLFLIARGVLRIIKLRRGNTTDQHNYRHGFVPEGVLGILPPLMEAPRDILIGFIITGLLMLGAWTAIFHYLIGLKILST